MRFRRASTVVVAAACAAAMLGCPGGLTEVDEQLVVTGQLDRDSETDGSAAVPVSYASTGSRGEWWPCDLRLTAQGCVGDHHVNVFIARGNIDRIEQVGGAQCVSGDEADGVFEAIQDKSGGTHAIGSELQVFVVVASDMDDTPGAVFNDDTETTAVTRLTSGELRVLNWAGLDFIGLEIEGQTAEGRPLSISYAGPIEQPNNVAPLEGPSTCVESALTEP